MKVFLFVNKYLRIYIPGILITLLISCANQIPPPGGPEDKEPPFVQEHFPSSNYTNYTDKEIRIKFNEYLNKKSVIDGIHISPYFEEELILDWSGKELTIKFPEELKKNQTYVLTLSSEISDLQQNKMNKSYSLVFSTGDKIDSGVISGTIYDEDLKDCSILLFRKKENSFQTDKKPDYVTYPDKEGRFTFSGISNDEYRILGLKDINKNLIYDINQDKIGLFHKDIILNESTNKIQNVNIELGKEDTTKPVLNNIKVINNQIIQLFFNEPIDSGKISLNNFLLEKEGKDFLIKDYYRSGENSNSIFLFTEKLPEDTAYKLFIENIYDLFSNKCDKISTTFNSKNVSDTTSIKLIGIYPPDNSVNLDYLNADFYIFYNKPLNRESEIKSIIKLSDTSGNIYDYKYNFIDGATLKILPSIPLKQKSHIRLEVNLTKLNNNILNFPKDSILKYNFQTIEEKSFGEISGNLLGQIQSDTNLVIQLISVEKNRKTGYKQIIKYPESKFKLNRIIEGNYFLKVFKDSNNDYNYTRGSIIKNKFSESFFIIPDTLKIRARWPIKELNIDLEKLPR